MLSIPTYLLSAAAGGIGVVFLTAPLGALLLWRRMAFIGDTLAHASLLGIALAFSWHIPLMVGVLLISVIVATGIVQWKSTPYFSQDTLLAVLTYSLFAMGLVLLATLETAPMSLLSYLYGDILIISFSEIVTLYLVAAVILLLLYRYWKPILLVIISPDLASTEGLPIRRYEYGLMLSLAIAIAFAIKIVGVLLVGALLIIPNAASRLLAHHPHTMIQGGVMIGCVSVVSGLAGSYYWDLPTGPMIVLMAFGCFLLLRLVRQIYR